MENNRLRILRTRADFVHLKNEGQKCSPSRWVTFFSVASSTEQLRLGFTISRKVGTAVTRNRLRRWGREFFRQALKEGLQMGADINVVFRPMEPGFYKDLEHSEFDRAFAKGLGLVRTRLSKNGSSAH
ncbi:MAG: ribonuclease P protein component [Bdellovibrionaceae bacterium]|nr:ribonuclease P protein component [Pseudobdellovibrionaceae bacterium]